MTPSVKAPQDDYLEAFKERLRDPEMQRYLASPLFPVTTPDLSSEPAHKTPTICNNLNHPGYPPTISHRMAIVRHSFPRAPYGLVRACLR